VRSTSVPSWPARLRTIATAQVLNPPRFGVWSDSELIGLRGRKAEDRRAAREETRAEGRIIELR
jgi:hypothetical protein